MATTILKRSSYRCVHGLDPHTIHLNNNYELFSPTAEGCLDRMTTLHNYMHNNIKRINQKQSTLDVEKGRHFNIDDWVLGDRRNLQVQVGNNQSLIYKCLGPSKVIKGIGSHIYWLEVPEGTRWHKVVHTIVHKPFRRQDEPQDLDEDEEEICAVKKIVN